MIAAAFANSAEANLIRALWAKLRRTDWCAVACDVLLQSRQAAEAAKLRLLLTRRSAKLTKDRDITPPALAALGGYLVRLSGGIALSARAARLLCGPSACGER